MDEGTQRFENTHNTAEQLEESLLICMYIKPHKSACFGYKDTAVVLKTINIQQLHLNKHTEEYGTVNHVDRNHFLPSSKNETK